MNKLEVQAVVARAKRPIGEAISELSATTADAVRENPRAFVSVEGAAAFLRWQALQLDGNWDQKAHAEALDFMKRARIYG